MPPSNSALVRNTRIALLATHVAVGLFLSGAVFPWLGERGRAACFRWWSRRILSILHVRLRHCGMAAPVKARPLLVLSNHVSWLDIFVIRSHIECLFVAKSEIRGWPLVGWLVAKQGTVFVQRARRHDTSRVNSALETALTEGQAMAVFPEGTTTDGTEVKPFHGSLLQPLVQCGGYALPVALGYRYPDGRPNDKAAYAGDRSLWESTVLLASQPEIVAELHVLEPVHAQGKHRRDLAEFCSERIAEALNLPPPGKRRGTPGGLPAATP